MDENKINLFRQKAAQMGYDPNVVNAFIASKTSGNRPQGQKVVASALSDSQYTDLIKRYFPQEEWTNALRVMHGESGGRADAVGDNFPIKGQTIPSYGLFQIRALPGRPTPDKLLNPEFNVAYAANLWKNQGWRPWSAARKLGIK